MDYTDDIETLNLVAHPAARREPPSPDVQKLRETLHDAHRRLWEAQAQLLEPNTTRMVGRVARIDPLKDGERQATLWLALDDEHDRHQAIRLRAATDALQGLYVGARITLIAGWRYGRLSVIEVEGVRLVEDPMPEVKLPEAKPTEAKSQDGKLPTLDELEMAAREGGWGNLNHSVYRIPTPFHLTTSPKCRTKAFEGRAVEVQAILREVAEAEGLTVIAVAAEADHIHLLGVPAGAGGMPPSWQWSRWVGRWKALTSRRLKALPGLAEFEWQTGYALTSVHGGRQGAEDALEVVRRYVEAQGVQDAKDGAA